jgi:hypothetical protein
LSAKTKIRIYVNFKRIFEIKDQPSNTLYPFQGIGMTVYPFQWNAQRGAHVYEVIVDDTKQIPGSISTAEWHLLRADICGHNNRFVKLMFDVEVITEVSPELPAEPAKPALVVLPDPTPQPNPVTEDLPKNPIGGHAVLAAQAGVVAAPTGAEVGADAPVPTALPPGSPEVAAEPAAPGPPPELVNENPAPAVAAEETVETTEPAPDKAPDPRDRVYTHPELEALKPADLKALSKLRDIKVGNAKTTTLIDRNLDWQRANIK